MRTFRDDGHKVYIFSPLDRREKRMTNIKLEGNVQIIFVHTLNVAKTNMIEKGIGQLSMEYLYINAVKKNCKGVKFDLILYSTPPITFLNVIRYVKKFSPQAKTYLMLKDIFPQNALDIGMLKASGIRGLIYNFFRNKEKKLYALSDYIGCMSPANVEYVLTHNPEIPAERVEIAPNSVELSIEAVEPINDEKLKVREKYGLPTDKPIFIYGGNLGKPQGIDYLIKCLDANKSRKDCHFVVVGNGTEYKKIDGWYRANKGCCVNLMQRLPKEDYDMLVRSCDVGLIFLDHRFTIPNYPSRLLSYLEYKMPIICATDPNTDIGSIAEENGYGYWCESVKPEDFTALVDKMLTSDRKAMGEKGYDYLKQNYTVQNTYNIIMNHFKNV